MRPVSKCRKHGFVIAWTLCGLPGVGWGKDTLTEVLARLAVHHAVQIRYHEVRYLALMTEPWKGTGFIYAKPPDQMVKLQLQPTRELMAVSGGLMWYFDPAHNVRYRVSADEDKGSNLEVAGFLAIVNGDLTGLKSLYSMTFSSNDTEWVIVLSALRSKGLSADRPDIQVTGPVGAPVRKIIIKKSDGDRSEYLLSKSDAGELVGNTLDGLLSEARGK